eukprot:TRINITY_DN65235_c0_g1_i1.p1 TRINITY_DN65235_c0_g1~~TRINITY_DN65235_c0_g1_i1.p1  ORF type:complete len:315 (+),score=48.94 TRINITY_DN65235_c0_g1_i1:105-947(+)
MVRKAGVRETIIAGDLNAELNAFTSMSAFLVDAPEDPPCTPSCNDAELEPESNLDQTIGDGVAESVDLWHFATSARKEHRICLAQVPIGPTRAGWAAGQKSGPCTAWHLDHILYTSRTLELKAKWAALESDPDLVDSGLPSRCNPSDHLPIAALFKPSATPRLDIACAAELEREAGEIEARQAATRAALEAEMPSKSDNVETRSPDAIRAFRARRKELLQQQRSEREAFVEKLDELELDALEENFSLASWAESGKRLPVGSPSAAGGRGKRRKVQSSAEV